MAVTKIWTKLSFFYINYLSSKLIPGSFIEIEYFKLYSVKLN